MRTAEINHDTVVSLGIGVGLPLLLVAVVAEGLWRWWRKERD